MKPTVEELVAAQKVLDDARDRVREIVNGYAVKRTLMAYVNVYDGRVRVLLDTGVSSRTWKDGRGIRCLGHIMVDYDEAKIRDKLIEAEKVLEEGGR